MTVYLTSEQRTLIRAVLNVFGNGGPCHSANNHAFVNELLQLGTDGRKTHNPSSDCISMIDAILHNTNE